MTTQVGYSTTGEHLAGPYDYQVPLTAFTITPQASLLVLNPAGTLATGTINFPAGATDGQQFTWVSSQTQTAVTMTPATGDAVVNTVTAGVAFTRYSFIYRLATKTWYRA